MFLKTVIFNGLYSRQADGPRRACEASCETNTQGLSRALDQPPRAVRLLSVPLLCVSPFPCSAFSPLLHTSRPVDQ